MTLVDRRKAVNSVRAGTFVKGMDIKNRQLRSVCDAIYRVNMGLLGLEVWL